MNEELIKAYEQSTKFLALVSSDLGKEIRKSNPAIVQLAESIANQYRNEYIAYRLAESEGSKEILSEMDEYAELLEILPQTSYEAIAELKNDLEAKTKMLQNIMSFQPSTFFYKYFLNSISPHIKGGESMELQAELVKTNPRFNAWFKGSKVVNEDKNPMVVYHGTSGLKKEFNRFNFKIFPATYFAENRSYAEWFARIKGEKRVLIECYLKIVNPIDLTAFAIDLVNYEDFVLYIELKHGYTLPEAPMLKAMSDENGGLWAWQYLRYGSSWINYLKSQKEFDGFHYYENNPDDLVEGKQNITKAWMVFEPNQIKSVDTRNDTFSQSSSLFTMGKGGYL